jgi:hypothetical protein
MFTSPQDGSTSSSAKSVFVIRTALKPPHPESERTRINAPDLLARGKLSPCRMLHVVAFS